jgi:DNA mismatch endonuclease, patch repair protein
VADHLSMARRREVMARIRSRDTQPELLLRSAMWRAGLRGWRVDFDRVKGRPDIAFVGRRVAVFVDGALWHGNSSKYPQNLSREWRLKIASNVVRDRAVDESLTSAGWIVIRVWDFEIRRDPGYCVDAIRRSLAARSDTGSLPERRPGTSEEGPRYRRRR